MHTIVDAYHCRWNVCRCAGGGAQPSQPSLGAGTGGVFSYTLFAYTLLYFDRMESCVQAGFSHTIVPVLWCAIKTLPVRHTRYHTGDQ